MSDAFEKMQTVLSDLQALEQDLTQACNHLAAVLADPPSDLRTGAIRAATLPLFRHRARYSQLVQRLNSVGHLAKADTPLQGEARRQLLRHGLTRSQMWPAIEAMVARQTWPASFAPLVTRAMEYNQNRPLGMINAAMQALFELSNPQAQATAIPGQQSYSDIPLSGAHFFELIDAAQRILLAQGHAGPMRFLDMGCGGGSKVVAALGAFEDARGADFNPAYVTAAHTFLTQLGLDTGLIEQADALTYDRYGEFDVIYFYRPLKSPDLAARMEARVVEQARPGAVIVAPLNITLGRGVSAAARVADTIFVAHASAEDTRALHDRASLLGSEHKPGIVHDKKALGFWAPVVLQSQRNGFCLS